MNVATLQSNFYNSNICFEYIVKYKRYWIAWAIYRMHLRSYEAQNDECRQKRTIVGTHCASLRTSHPLGLLIHAKFNALLSLCVWPQTILILPHIPICVSRRANPSVPTNRSIVNSATSRSTMPIMCHWQKEKGTHTYNSNKWASFYQVQTPDCISLSRLCVYIVLKYIYFLMIFKYIYNKNNRRSNTSVFCILIKWIPYVYYLWKKVESYV